MITPLMHYCTFTIYESTATSIVEAEGSLKFRSQSDDELIQAVTRFLHDKGHSPTKAHSETNSDHTACIVSRR